jgi:hypothetical protein
MNPDQNSGQNGGQLPPQNAPQPTGPNPVSPTQQFPAPQQAAPGPDQFDFIFNPQTNTKRSVLPGSGSPILMRVLMVLGGLTLLVIAAVIFFSILGSGDKEKTTNLLTIAQEQTELVRIATDASLKATTLPAQSLAQNIQASVGSQKNELLKYMKDNGVRTSPVQLTLKHSKTTDTTLQTAKANNTYDTAFRQVIQTELDSYISSLQRAYKADPGPKGKQLLAAQYDGAVLLKKASTQL